MATKIALRKRNGILEFLGYVTKGGKIKKPKTKRLKNPTPRYKAFSAGKLHPEYSVRDTETGRTVRVFHDKRSAKAHAKSLSDYYKKYGK